MSAATRRTLAFVVLVAGAFAAGPDAPAKAEKEPPRLALLVGCTKYPNHPSLRELNGPKNDVRMWGELLTDPKGFAFPDKNVTRLADWPADESKRPTHANIVKGFEALIARAEPDSRVVIVLCGHGIQVPIPESQVDPLDPRNPEPDGLDEVFLPADVGDWTAKDGLKNALLDDHVGAFLDRLRAKGAHVLVVFDCCHSGTMTRSGPGVREISRSASHDQLKIKEEAIKAATARAAKAVAAAKKAGKPIPGEGTAKPTAKGAGGSLVAFYAAQPFEEAPEMPFPDDAPAIKENYYGMLSWTLAQALKGRGDTLSYGELQRLVSTGYRSARGAKPPTPFAEGDLERQVLGLRIWPKRQPIYVQKDRRGKFSLDAGLLRGVTPESILAVHPPPGDKRDAKTVLAHVRVTSAHPSAATVVPVKRAGKDGEWEEAPGDAEKIPSSGQCEIVVRDFGDMRVKCFATAGPARAAFDKLDPKVKELVRLVPKEQDADWLLRETTPEEAKKTYGVALVGNHVLLVQGEGKTRLAKEAAQARFRKVFGRYPLADEKAAIRGLEIDLPKVFKWENLWRVAGGVNASDGGETHGLTVEVLKLKDEKDTKGEELRGGVARDGDEVAFWVRNGGSSDLWVTAFYLDSNLQIQIVPGSGGVGRGKRVKLGQGPMSTKDGSAGTEGLVVFAIPQSVQRDNPDFSMLEQEPLKVPEAAKRSARKLPETPFGKLLGEAAFRKGTRGWGARVATNPAILTRSWVLVP